MPKWTIDPKYGFCRALSHQWEIQHHPHHLSLDHSGKKVLASSICKACGMYRFTAFAYRTGERAGGGYIYPEGYLFKGVGGAKGRPRKYQLRQAFFPTLNLVREKEVIRYGSRPGLQFLRDRQARKGHGRVSKGLRSRRS